MNGTVSLNPTVVVLKPLETPARRVPHTRSQSNRSGFETQWLQARLAERQGLNPTVVVLKLKGDGFNGFADAVSIQP